MSDLKPTHVFIVLLAAALTGVILGLSMGTLAWLLEWSRPWAFGLGTWALTIAAAWLLLLRRSLRIIEGVLGLDLDRDGVIGEPANPRIIIMDQTDKGATEGMILDRLPGGEAKFARMAAGIIRGQPFAERFWTGKNGPYSLSEWRDLRDYLLLRGLLDWKSELDHRQGVDLQPAGKALVRRYATLLPSIWSDQPAIGVPRVFMHACSTHARPEEVIIDE